MRKTAAILALAAASLAACTPPTSAGQVAVRADADLAGIENAYVNAKAFAAILMPLLPADKAARIVAAEKVADAALVVAHAALTAAERAAAVDQVKAATDQLDATSAAI